MIFATGTELIIENKNREEPQFYRFGESCLATDFTNHSDVESKGFKPVRYSGETYQNYYSSFALEMPDENCTETGDCKGGSSGQIDMEFDEKINFMSLGLFWLRILLLKTVVFNILMTFKAWMS
ncbi:M1-specific T cell receptor alpha chain-like [Chanodichthys erythropterus]|uniref:M1-specific T cell receptor alpha chain-like n=1 Tax=Chanodichthys erythropterus TaxID=933992 RepID=UPI00351E2DD3